MPKVGDTKETKITAFNLGITNEPRANDQRYCSIVKNFDIHSFSHKLVPLRSTKAGDSNVTAANRVRNFCIAKLSSTEYALYGLAKQSANNRHEVFYKKITIDSSNNLADQTWTNTANNTGGTGTTAEFDLFIYYEKTGLIYSSRDLQFIVSYDPDGGTGFNSSERDLTSYTTIRQGIVHSKDDVLYIPYDNKIAKNNNGSWTSVALTLPTHLQINSICEYGNFVAIMASPKSGFGKTVVYLWNRDETTPILSESIDWGEGEGVILDTVDGVLVGISNVGKSGDPAQYSNGPQFNQHIVFRYYDGSKAKVFNEFISQESTSFLTSIPKKYKYNNYLYFPLFMTFPDGSKQEGIWKIGPNREGTFAISLDRTPINNTEISLTTFLGFIVVGDFLLLSYLDGSSNIQVRKTLERGDSSEFTATSIYETIVFNGESSRMKKKLIAVVVETEPLPATGQVVLKYKKDEDIDGTTYTTIFTNTTDDSIHQSSVTSLPEYKEIVFRIESTGGAVITGLLFKYEYVGKDIFD